MIFLGLLLGLALTFSIPSVQNYAAQQAVKLVKEETGLDLQMRTFRFQFPNRIHLEGAFLPDYHGDTLFYVGSLDADFQAYGSFSESFRFYRVNGDSLFCYMTTYEDGNSMSEFVKTFDTGKPADPNALFNLRIEALNIENSRYYLRDRTAPESLAFYWQDVKGSLKDFFVSGKEVGGEVEALVFQDPQGFAVNDLRASVLYGDHGIRVREMGLTTSRGFVNGDVALLYDEPSDFSSFLDSVRMRGDIFSSSVAAEDIQYFGPQYPNFPAARLNGHFDGTVNDLSLSEFEVSALNRLNLSGELHISEPTSAASLGLNTKDLSIEASGSEIRTIIKMFSESELPEFIEDQEIYRWSGSYQGGLYAFNTNSSLRSDLISANLDLEMQDLANLDRVNYVGDVAILSASMDRLLGQRDLGNLKARFNLNGQGLDPAEMHGKIKGDIADLAFKGYSYQNININGAIKDGRFDGNLAARDPNMSFDFNGRASFIADTSEFDFRLKVDSANLFAVNLVQDSAAQYQGFIDIDFRALNYDDWEGQIALRESQYRNSRRYHYIQDVEILSMNTDIGKQLLISSDIMEGRLYGNYSLDGLTQVFSNTLRKFSAPGRYRSRDSLNLNFNYDLEFKNTTLLSQLLVPKLLVEPGTKLEGSYAFQDDRFKMKLNSLAIRYDEHLFTGIDLDFISSYDLNKLNFFIDKYRYRGEEIRVDSLSLKNNLVSDSLNYELSLIMRDSIDSQADFKGKTVLTDTNAFLVSFDSGAFNLGVKNFAIDPQSLLRVDSNGLSFDWFRLYGEELEAEFSGYVSNDPNKILRADIKDLNLDLLNYFLANEKSIAKGYLDASIVATELSGEAKFLGDISIDTLKFNEVNLGSLLLETDFDYTKETMYLKGALSSGSLKTLEINGFYQTFAQGTVDLEFDFNRFRLAALDPFASPIAENIRGLMNGKLSLKGNVNKPDIDGELFLPKTALTVSFLQTDYNLVDNPRVLINNDRIAFPDLQLRDTRYGTNGILRGEVRHRNFQDFFIDLYFLADELLVLNTTSDLGDAYYGTAYATGRINIQGPPSKVKVGANVSSARKTNFNIPIGGATEVKSAGYVNFLPPPSEEDSLSVVDYNFDLDEGVSLDFDIDVNSNARVSIILNESTGNKLNANGDGLIKMKLEPNEDLELFGTYTVSKGEYQFNIEGLFRKDFVVQEGGTVVWNGDPYAARLDLTAVYTTKANPGVITGESNSVITPVEVYLFISGVLTNPEINFEIKMPRASSSSQSIVSNRLNTDQAINQQVFSLLAFNSFTPPSNFFAGAGSGINQWDIIANQAAAFLNRFTGDYRVSLSYQPANEIGGDATTSGLSNEELEVGLSKNFLDERLTINSSVEVPLNENNNSIAGDFELIYSLTPDGRVRAKAFNRSVDNRYNLNISQQQLYQQGVGLSFKTDFNTYQEMWKRILGKAKEEDPPLEMDPFVPEIPLD